MRIDVLTLFPGMFTPLSESILGRAREEDLIQVYTHDLRQFGLGQYKQIDDRPYGGGAGMVLRPDTVIPALEHILEEADITGKKPWIIHLTPRGELLKQPKLESIAATHEWIILVCGHYEGIDQRVIDSMVDEEIRIGDYILTGGELPAMVLIDAVARHIPGVLGKDESAQEESFSASLDYKREYPHYTRPEEYRGMRVPEVLLSGHHAEIEKWRKENLL